MHALTQTPKRLPGKEGVWFFIAADMTFFSLFFLSYMHERSLQIDLFTQSQQTLNFNFGGINTLILLTSSWFVVQAVRAAKADRLDAIARNILFALASATAFATLKIVEYIGKYQAGIGITSNDFFSFYFFLTGVHFFHVIGGSVVLLTLWKNARNGAYSSTQMTGLESGATYWHMVDLLWIVIFPLLYLMK
ncbi:cytochrome c oxidase subunit 3 family protein [Pseudomonas fluorescens]|uniref:Cytochrome c oxidase subunit 3 n=1 Tax=Pseudomonas fluorescens TaxID=294 RepID=A0A5E7UV83_PSEFL|nr:cytochrome c oxidase subunit 3 family protein [Pseudomonas fluorescens]VVQ15487.1 Cytochrome c oxidase subunit 3 [Pseudomonas fluorescens]